MGKAFIFGVGGGGGVSKPEEAKTETLSMASGNQVIMPTVGKVLTKVTITKPLTMTSDNIRRDVNIGGVTGTFVGTGVTQPTLNSVSIARSGAVFNITNPSTNGNFAKGYKVFSNGNLVDEISTTSFALAGFSVGTHTVIAKAKGNSFNDSLASNSFNCSVYAIGYELIGLTSNNLATKIADNQTFTTTLKADMGKYLPEYIALTMGGVPIEYTYDSYSGAITVLNVTGDIQVTATAYEQAKLRTPSIVLEDYNLGIASVRYAQQYDLYSDGVIEKVYTEYSDFEVVSVDGASYGFAMNDNGYYESLNKRIQNSYALCRVNLSLSSAKTVRFNCISNGESSYDFGILSNIDTTLTLSNATDTANVKKSFSGIPSTSVQPVLYDMPAGNHFIYLKYRKDGSGDNGNDPLQFNVEFE